MGLIVTAILLLFLFAVSSGLSISNKSIEPQKMIRNGKYLQGSRLKDSIPSAALSLGVVLPVWLTTLLPLAIVDFVASSVKGMIMPSQGRKLSDYWETGIESRPSDALDSSSPRELDLVIYGATGFTGKILTKYIAKNYNGKIRWGISGRSKERLEAVRSSLGPEFANLPIIIADSEDSSAVTKLVRKTKAIANTAGPFSMYANILVGTCAQQGTHYADITGEVDWVKVLIDKYDVIAQESGARIVNMCGCDCVPWEMSVHGVATEFKKRGYGELREVNCYDSMKASFSGGTLKTVVTMMNDNSKYKAKSGFNPLLMMPDGSKSTAKYSGRPQFMMGYSREINSFTGFFVMSAVMAQSIKRSNALNKYSSDLIYREALVFPNIFAAIGGSIGLLAGATAFATTPLRWLMYKFGVVPQASEGPSEKTMDSSFLEVKTVAHGVGADGTSPAKVETRLYFPTCPGYRDTARMLGETALTMVLDSQRPEVNKNGGVMTPSAACGTALLDRLVETGCEYIIE